MLDGKYGGGWCWSVLKQPAACSKASSRNAKREKRLYKRTEMKLSDQRVFTDTEKEEEERKGGREGGREGRGGAYA